jgi:hypothetical protein
MACVKLIEDLMNTADAQQTMKAALRDEFERSPIRYMRQIIIPLCSPKMKLKLREEIRLFESTHSAFIPIKKPQVAP